ncbi:hypothetical protein DY000_02052382 [Brassica cretica]|uniref:RNase H type-1 domain-containing protein n=1 Tax=Brassica cretica TaxID=69181 RepID=A0ABQ7ACQ4_BRACR|nr:hypothetical protein DY000_02052382 [Brassica cretica]
MRLGAKLRTEQSVRVHLIATYGRSNRIRSALLHALEAGILEICIKSDCQALIAALSSKRHPADLYGITWDIETILTFYPYFILFHFEISEIFS